MLAMPMATGWAPPAVAPGIAPVAEAAAAHSAILGPLRGAAARRPVGQSVPPSDVEHATPRRHEHRLDVGRPDVYPDERRHGSIMAQRRQ